MKSPFTHPGAGLPENDWQSQNSSHDTHYAEKTSPEQKPRVSKRRIWRLFRLGFALILAITGLVLNLIILVDAGGEFSLLTVGDSAMLAQNLSVNNMLLVLIADRLRRST